MPINTFSRSRFFVFKALFLNFLFITTLTNLSSLFAQLPLNLDFEKLSTEGIDRPWGWIVNAYASNTRFECDSLEIHSGKYSLKIQNGEKGDTQFFELAHFIEPSQIYHKKLLMEAWIKTKDLQGEAGIRIHSMGSKGDEFVVLKDDKTMVATGSNNWKKYQAEIEIGADLHTVNVSAFLSSYGTIWIDNIRFKIDDKRVAEVPVAPDFSKQQINWIKKNSLPFSTVEPSTQTVYRPGDFSDLGYFKKMVGDARIIALGESTHGTSEFFKVKHRLFQYAVYEMGVRVFVLEDNQLLVERINDFVINGKGKANEVIKGLFAVWNTQEMLSLIQWVRAYNLAHPADKVEFVGMDVQNPQLAIDSLYTYLKQKDSTLLEKIDLLLTDYKEGWRNAFFMNDSTLVSWTEKVEQAFRLVENKKKEWLESATTYPDSTTVHWAIQNARLLTQNMASIQSFGFEGRDKAMAENVSWILNHRKAGTRIIVWAHDSHINRGEAKEQMHNYFLGQSMGAHLAKKYADDYRAFGLFTYQGTCRGTVSYRDFTSIEFKLFTSPKGSLDEGLHQVSILEKSPLLMLDLRSARNPGKSLEWIQIQRPVRYVGYVAEDYGFGGRYVIPDQFDGLIFVDESTASKKGIKK